MPIIFTQGVETWTFALRQDGPTGFLGNFQHSNTADRTYNLPNKSGTIALLSDILNNSNPEGLQFLAQTVTNGIASVPAWIAASFTIGNVVVPLSATIYNLAGLGTVEAESFVGDLTGNADTVTTIPSLSGDVINIGNNVSLRNLGIVPGTYNQSQSTLTPFTVDAKGRITALGTPFEIVTEVSTVEIGTVEMGVNPSVINSGTPEQAVLDFVFPNVGGANTVVVTGTTVLSDAFNSVIVDSQFNCDIFLPAGENNQTYTIKSVNSGLVTLRPHGFDTIEKLPNYQLLLNNSFDLVFFNGNWYIK